MIINKTKKFMFIHIPKTAGTSLQNALTGSPVKPKHNYMKDVKYAGFFTFAFVRNPWDRLLSLHTYASERNLIKQKDFKQWLLFEEWWEGEEIKFNQQKDRLPYQRRPMSDWITDNNTIVVDFIGKFETLQTDINVLRKQHGIDIAPLSHINRTDHFHHRDVYDDEMKEFVSHHHKIDITNFDYEF